MQIIKYPVDVKKIEQDHYKARLADFPNGPSGLGNDPYSALEDLEKVAKKFLSLSLRNNLLTEPSKLIDRPAIDFDPEENTIAEIDFNKSINTYTYENPSQMINYSWTNREFI
ncbi:MAG: hypothetical protein CBC47_09575 [Alphaproteobacteria bacterium TMED87]|nr:hypothetical protein [Rhodospirillaceae bacterium]OUV07164.1 MAG: hypothetical protein CBC47_09575 [Alphaproteobacteria bacterium TMED87]|tara:strand:- start:73 stop:411 length:339 start_codon:yes stop_codon:yes gene_type:complete